MECSQTNKLNVRMLDNYCFNLWAYMFGPIYAALNTRLSCIPRSLVLSVSCAGLLLVLLINLNRVLETTLAVVLIFGLIALALIHSLTSISFFVNYHRKQRGRWLVRMNQKLQSARPQQRRKMGLLTLA